MNHINRVFFSGELNADAESFEISGGGFECLMHLSIPAGGRGHIWIAVYWRGNKAESYFDQLRKGASVFIEGSLASRNEVADRCIMVNASTVSVAPQGKQ